jgi:hypothetical protein
MLTTIKMTVVVVDGGLLGDATPGASICPASADNARFRLRIVTAQVRRKVFTLDAS